MKILIWIACLLVNSIITVVIKVNGIILGGIPTLIMYMITFAGARTLCEKWEEHKCNKEKRNRVVEDEYADKIGFCRKCGKKLLENSQFCNDCGTEIFKEEE